ncbi:hypothetical protein B0H14DRAFT_2618809 [Mycena olivaceomarginata]|nr:hypothetical protein B0H14DRAFT_2618809 [Mycena olivaceomarginata]
MVADLDHFSRSYTQRPLGSCSAAAHLPLKDRDRFEKGKSMNLCSYKKYDKIQKEVYMRDTIALLTTMTMQTKKHHPAQQSPTAPPCPCLPRLYPLLYALESLCTGKWCSPPPQRDVGTAVLPDCNSDDTECDASSGRRGRNSGRGRDVNNSRSQMASKPAQYVHQRCASNAAWKVARQGPRSGGTVSASQGKVGETAGDREAVACVLLCASEWRRPPPPKDVGIAVPGVYGVLIYQRSPDQQRAMIYQSL